MFSFLSQMTQMTQIFGCALHVIFKTEIIKNYSEINSFNSFNSWF